MMPAARRTDPMPMSPGTAPKPPILDRLCAAVIITMPLLPKVELSREAFINFSDLFMVVFCVLVAARRQYWLGLRSQRMFVFLMTSIFLATAPHGLLNEDINSTFKALKKFLYIPVFWVGYKTWKSDKSFSYLFTTGAVIVGLTHVIYYLFLPKAQGLKDWTWNGDAIFSGLSNRYLDLDTFQLLTSPTGAHGIWATYCAMLVILGVWVYRQRMQSILIFAPALALLLYSVLITPSRESLVFLLVSGAFVVYHLAGRSAVTAAIWAFAGVAAAVLLALLGTEFIDELMNMPIGDKLLITFEQIFYYNTFDGSALARIGTFQIIADMMAADPIRFILGSGYETKYYFAGILEQAMQSKAYQFSTVPESWFAMCLSYGGIVAALLYFASFHALRADVLRGERSFLRTCFMGLVAAFFVNSMVFSAAMTSDYVFGWFLLLMGYYVRRADVQRAVRGYAAAASGPLPLQTMAGRAQAA